jgi:hypothetical protein
MNEQETMKPESSIDTFSEKPKEFRKYYNVAESIPRGTPTHKLNRSQRERLKMLSRKAFGVESKWQDIAEKSKKVTGRVVDTVKTKNTDKPVYRNVLESYTADEIEQLMEKTIVVKDLPTELKEKLNKLSANATNNMTSWIELFNYDPRPASSSEEIFKSIIETLESMIQYNDFSLLKTGDQITKIVDAIVQDLPLLVPVCLLSTNENKDSVSTELLRVSDEIRNKFMQITGIEKKQYHFNFDALDVAKQLPSATTINTQLINTDDANSTK